MSGSAKQSRVPPREQSGLLRRRAPRNDVVGFDLNFFKQQKKSRGVMSPEVLHLASPSKQ
jgi:hypothetical protein